MGRFFAIAVVALALTGEGPPFLALAAGAARVPAVAAAGKPSPSHLIVGSAISLPSVLFESAKPGSSLLVTDAEAHAVETTMWRLREEALVASDTRALSQLTSSGPMLQGFINNCAYPGGRCVPETTPRLMKSLHVIVPVERSYPLYFLAEIQTTQGVTTSSGLNQWEPWMELQILTKASASASWKVSFDSGYTAASGGTPPPLPFALAPVADSGSSAGGSEEYNIPVSSVEPEPEGSLLPLLAAYWQSYKDTGHAPAHTHFVADGETNGEGTELAQTRQGSIYAGSRETFQFQGDPSAGSWLFSVTGGFAMECGSVLDDAANTAISGDLYQNADETNYGPPLAPGYYTAITTAAVHESCVYVVPGGLDVAGDDVDSANVVGEGFIADPAETKSTPLSVLQTDYGVLTYQLGHYRNVLYSCKGSTTACEKTFATDSGQQLANFVDQLQGLPLASKAAGEVASVVRTGTVLVALFGEITGGTATAATFSLINTDSPLLSQQYDQLVAALS